MKFWKPQEGAKLTIIGKPPALFEHFIPETKACPKCGEQSSNVRSRSYPPGVEMCDCCFATVWAEALPKLKQGETLTEALKSLGYGHRPSTTPGKRTLFHLATGEELPDQYSAHEGWDLVHRLRGDQ